MQLIARPNFFIVAINKELQKQRKERQGSLYVVTGKNDESRNMQSGIIVSIGTRAADIFPQAKIGDTLLLHWQVESKEKNYKFWEDGENNYYHVTATECNGRPNEAYGVWDGEKLIPNPEYIFLTVPHVPKRDMTPDEYIAAATRQTEQGIFVFDEWTETRKDKEEKMAKIKSEIDALTKTKMSPQLAVAIAKKEEELAIISNDINKARIEFFKVAAINPDFAAELKYCFGHEVAAGDKVGFLNQATKTTIDFQGTTYIIALSKHFHCPERWCKESVAAFQK